MSGPEPLEALTALGLNWVVGSQDVWRDAEVYVPDLHRSVAAEVRRSIADARRMDPPGLVVEGEAGTGKTQLLGWVREQAQRDGGYFFLIALANGESFWEGAVEALLDGLLRPHAQSETQLRLLIGRLGERAGSSRLVQAVAEGRRASRTALDKFVTELAPRPGLRDAVRALAMLAAEDPEAQELGRAHLASDEVDPQQRAEYGLGASRGAERTVRQLSAVLAMTAPSVVAVDQLDPLIARTASSPAKVDSAEVDAPRDHVVNQVAQGLMGLREGSEHMLVLLTCIPNSWRLIKEHAVAPVADRFRVPPLSLDTIPNAEVAREIVGKHLGARYAELGFAPKYPTWPVRAEVFEAAAQMTPRELLRRIDAHVRACIDAGEVVELAVLDAPAVKPEMKPADDTAYEELDREFALLRETADVERALDPKEEDLGIPPLLEAGLAAWVLEQGTGGDGFELDPTPSTNPPTHAGLKRTVDERIDAQVRWAFRAIAHPNARAMQTRLRRAIQQSGIDEGDGARRLVILRRDAWPSGPKTAELVADFERRGGLKLDVDVADLRTYEALRKLMHENGRHPALQSWLVARRPASHTVLLRTALPVAGPQQRSRQDTGPPTTGTDTAPAIDVGAAGDRPVRLNLASLRMHVAVFAGSGSGKTVLLRRLIEECALHGVGAIVLDPNNDLARLGDAWPREPRGWRDGDAARARDYLTGTDIVVWTPGLRGGRPLTFQPLPDFAGVLDDPDEFQQAVDVALAALAPRARVDGRTTKAERQRAVLRESVDHFGRRGGGPLPAFIELLRDLPEDASTIDGAPAMAADMAETLKATRVNDPLFGGTGVSADPGVLLTPAGGKRARISVISFVGLTDEQRPGFVSQLQMALFSWFKRNPAGDRPLGGLLVMDEAQNFAPSGATTAATESTLILASQARKYGLGLVFATQAPKGLHNRIPGNAATQFFGRLNSPIQITTARELARAKGGDVPEISLLGAGDFYVAADGTEFQRLRTLNCLSHHPPSPLSREEVIARARQ